MKGVTAGWARKLLWCIAISALLAAVLGYVPAAPWSRRAPSTQETVLYYFAQELGEPALCGRISWDAYRSHGLLLGGGGASRWRSDCYERVAEAAGDDSLCWEVRPFVDLDPFSPGYSALGCGRRTHNGYKSGIALTDQELVGAFRTLGYDLDDMHLEGVVQPPVRPDDAYLGLAKDPAIGGRIGELLARGAGLQANDRTYLLDLAAIAGADPKSCAAIDAGESSVHQLAPFRDWCYFTVAYNSGDTRLCAHLTPAKAEPKVMAAEAAGVQPGTAEQLSLHSQCTRIGAYGTSRPYRYGPELPTGRGQVQRLLTILGVSPQPARDWPVEKQAAYLHEVMSTLALRRPVDAARDAARAELVHRLLALPQTP